MRKAIAVFAVLLLAGCSAATTPTGNHSSSGGKATIDLTVSGAMAGSTTQIVKQ